MQSLLKQAQDMQRKMQETQHSLGERMLEGSAGGGAVKVYINGNLEVQAVKIQKAAVDPEDVDTLEDLVTVALRNGRTIEHFAPCRKGDPEAPLTDADLNDKFLELASPVIGDAPARTLLDQLWHVERQDLASLRLRTL